MRWVGDQIATQVSKRWLQGQSTLCEQMRDGMRPECYGCMPWSQQCSSTPHAVHCDFLLLLHEYQCSASLSQDLCQPC